MRLRLLASVFAFAAAAGCNVDVTQAEFNVDRVDLTSVASAAWDVRVAFEMDNATAHEETVRVEPNGFESLSDRLIPQGDYRIVASTSVHTASRGVFLDGHTKGVTISVAEGGTLGISLIG